MIIKLRDGFHGSAQEPIALILSETEKKAISQMGDGNFMIAFYPTNGGFTPELITQWMQEGIQVQQEGEPVAVSNATAAPSKDQIIDAEFTIAEPPKHE